MPSSTGEAVGGPSNSTSRNTAQTSVEHSADERVTQVREQSPMMCKSPMTRKGERNSHMVAEHPYMEAHPQQILWTITERCSNREFQRREQKNYHSLNLRISSWSYHMAGHAKKCVERCCELANKTTQQLYKVSSPCIDDHHCKEEEMKSVGEFTSMLSNCSKMFILSTNSKA